ncbi:hypothetical protein CU669_06855 [Paramagnetospirillum kuznetsovii]|uniref:DUF4375 domain-containing protein n=1 Tax=Paramagnetospirillum kuznetsovii TaxID=2053833 RepID=A0A364NZF7_9PROT|nr:hypothetical protein [Paramagnetospirillum kuznetsovii]RAU22423.1 hypothetical protein CU669_06855 [Paramagnetospirillum kuznetsovii]
MSLNAAKAAFDSLKSDFRDGRFPMIGARLCGEAVEWGQRLLDLYRTAGRDELEKVDAMARFWVLRYRGMPESADLTGADGAAGFVMAFTAFPYLDLMMEAWELGEPVEEGADRLRLRALFDGKDEGDVVTAVRSALGWSFDLMGLYRAKARTFENFINVEYGDFDSFVDYYVAEHDLDFNFEQAWRPLIGA